MKTPEVSLCVIRRLLSISERLPYLHISIYLPLSTPYPSSLFPDMACPIPAIVGIVGILVACVPGVWFLYKKTIRPRRLGEPLDEEARGHPTLPSANHTEGDPGTGFASSHSTPTLDIARLEPEQETLLGTIQSLQQGIVYSRRLSPLSGPLAQLSNELSQGTTQLDLRDEI
ncbi:hypothetical protein F5Y15DRAFT_273308 [Xylariaceae sp. FL0016]|nr:hypothetical protein F5Y15DRAFT_273308 [Xylariaceae sp. FL0016]